MRRRGWEDGTGLEVPGMAPVRSTMAEVPFDTVGDEMEEEVKTSIDQKRELDEPELVRSEDGPVEVAVEELAVRRYVVFRRLGACWEELGLARTLERPLREG